jgi:hypothetical protein
LFTWKSKKQKKEFLEVALPSALTIALGKLCRVHWSMHSAKRFFKKTNFFAECLGYGTRQRGFFLKKKFFAECCTRQRN